MYCNHFPWGTWLNERANYDDADDVDHLHLQYIIIGNPFNPFYLYLFSISMWNFLFLSSPIPFFVLIFSSLILGNMLWAVGASVCKPIYDMCGLCFAPGSPKAISRYGKSSFINLSGHTERGVNFGYASHIPPFSHIVRTYYLIYTLRKHQQTNPLSLVSSHALFNFCSFLTKGS